MKRLLTLTIMVSALLWAAMLASAAAPCDITLNPGDDIQTAINNATAGDVICLNPGIYSPSAKININRSVTLQGPQAGVDPRLSVGTTRTPGGTSTEAIIDGSASSLSGIIVITADNVILDGLEVRNGRGDLIDSETSTPTTGTILRYNIIHDSSGDEGIQLRACTDCVVELNYVFDMAQDGINMCCGSTGGIIHFNEVHDNYSENAAIYVYGSTDMTIQCNLVYNVFENDGIKLGSKDGSDAARSGGSILYNTVHDTVQDGIAVYTSDTLVEGNKVYHSASENGAIYVAWGVSNITILLNDVHNNTLKTRKWGNPGAIMIGTAVDASAVHVTGNNIYGNSPNGATNKAGAALDATSNWWGATDGPSGAGPGSGDAVSANVTFAPWLTGPQAIPDPCVLDDQGPVTSGVAASPNPVAANNGATVAASVDDTGTGGSNIASAEYSLDGGTTWFAMAVQDGAFDEVSEDVTASFGAPGTAGIYDLCVRGTDAATNIGDPECIMLVVYDPDGGFVTGGGWIDSPPGAYMPSPSGIVVVTGDNVGVDWFTNDTRYDGYIAFVEGPDNPPLGVGSLEMGTTASQDKAQLFNYDHIGTALADIDAISYATYRSSASTNSAAQYPAINIEVDYAGDGSSYTTLVWEPIYAYGQSNLAIDTWQTWDTMAPSQTSFGGGWWSTKDIPGVCAFNCFVDWDTILQNNPNAKIKYGFGVNVGSGWTGTFTGAVDALTLSVSGGTVTYDFEPVAPFDPTGKATFGFVSKYKKGAQTPEGNTEFVFKAADLNFHSSSYDWLVVAGAKAKFKGTGTINGVGNYGFMLSAIDAELTPSTDVDLFRIKIWDKDNGDAIVYDNQMDALDDADPTTAIGGGSIVIHTKKK
jgi:hypothetical protein